MEQVYTVFNGANYRFKLRVPFNGKQESPTEKEERKKLANVLIISHALSTALLDSKIGVSSRNKIATFS